MAILSHGGDVWAVFYNGAVNRILFAGFGTLMAVSVAAQEAKPLVASDVVSCASTVSGGHRSRWTVSTSGVAAAAETQIKLIGRGASRYCRTSWILHARGADGKERKITVAERDDRPGDNEWTEESSFEVNAWSSNGKIVLTSQIEASGDSNETTPLVYDFETGRYWRAELAPLFKEKFPEDCIMKYSLRGLLEDGNVLVEAMPTDDELEEERADCFAATYWEVDVRNSKATHTNRTN